MSIRKGCGLGRASKASRIFKALPDTIGCDGISGTAFEMRSALNKLLATITLDPGGATVLEYAMVAFFISIAAFSAIMTIGTDVAGMFSRIAGSF